MNDKYLWDRSGPPDPEIEQLERSLAPYRYRPRMDVLRQARPAPRLWWGALAASLLAGVGIWQTSAPAPRLTDWQVAKVEGSVRMGREDAALSMALRAGQTLRTGRDAELRLEANSFGQLDLGPDSELRASSTRQLQLNHGTLHAFIWARPGEFIVDTPSARATDLGCMYTIKVDPGGNGLLQVSFGWVAFQHSGRESFIPAGAACVTRKKQGPGIPYYEDAAESFRTALADFENGNPGALAAILASARTRDGLTLWHLLARVREQNRGAVYDRFAQLVTLPPEVSREGALRLDAEAMDLCWNALNLENTEWWRGWERKWGE